MKITYPDPYTKKIDDKNCKQKNLWYGVVTRYLFRLSRDIITQRESKKSILLNWGMQ